MHNGRALVRALALLAAATFLPQEMTGENVAMPHNLLGAKGFSTPFRAPAPSPSPSTDPLPAPSQSPIFTPTAIPRPSVNCSGPATHVPGGPDGTGTCWPGPNNTGVPIGTILTTYTGPNTIRVANTVIHSKIINCTDFNIQAANVVIKNSKVNCHIWLDMDLPGSSGWSLTVEDSEVDAGAVNLPAIGTANLTVIRSNIRGGLNGLQCDVPMQFCVLKDSWIHGQYQYPNVDTHLGGFLSNGGTNISLVHNSVFCDAEVNNVGGGCTGDINFIPNFAAITGALIQHNLLGANLGSSYCTYAGEKSSSSTPHSHNIVYQDNVFQRGTNGRCAAYGPVTGFGSKNAGNKWINNTWDDGAPLPALGGSATPTPSPAPTPNPTPTPAPRH